jgi:hypothetical protein
LDFKFARPRPLCPVAKHEWRDSVCIHEIFLLFFQICEAVGSLIGPCISRHFNNKKAGCLDATIKIGIPVTIYRFWVMDGKYKLIVLEGIFILIR